MLSRTANKVQGRVVSFALSNFTKSFAVLQRPSPEWALRCTYFAPLCTLLAHANNVALSILVRCIYVESGVKGGGKGQMA